MRAQASFVPGVTSRGCPLTGSLEHTAFATLTKDQGYSQFTQFTQFWLLSISCLIFLEENCSRTSLFWQLELQFLTLFMISFNLINDGFIYAVFKLNSSVLLKLDADEFCLLALPSTPHFFNAHVHCTGSQENVRFLEALNPGCVGKLLILYISPANSVNGGGGTWWKIAA